MGARKKHAPKRGSLAFMPRKRAKSLVPTIKYWPNVDVDGVIPLGFAGYKAGMTSVFYIDNYKNSPTYGKEVFSAVTIVETPPLYVLGVVAYVADYYANALKTFATAVVKDVPDFIRRRIKTLKSGNPEMLGVIEENLDKIAILRLLCAMQPHKAGIHKKKPEIFEIQLGGKSTIDEKWEYVKQVLGGEIKVTDVFKPGQYIDVIAVTKGKGFQGPVKRFGIKILQHKARKCKRKPGALGPWKPSAVMYTVPLFGQMGLHRRTIYKLKILDIRSADEFDFPLEFRRYGQITGSLLPGGG
ncbi:50S ribosomal protein L3, partial [Candidatus Geothermarchaeota archaeon ex4572_27]